MDKHHQQNNKQSNGHSHSTAKTASHDSDDELGEIKNNLNKDVASGGAKDQILVRGEICNRTI